MGGLLCPRGGLGTDVAVGDSYAHVMLLLWDGSDETEQWKLAVVDTKKPSSLDSFSMRHKFWSEILKNDAHNGEWVKYHKI